MLDDVVELPVTALDGLPHDGDQQLGHHPSVEGQVVWNHLEQGGRERWGSV